MALKQAVDRATMAQLCLGAGVASFILAMTVRRLRDEHLARHRPSKRSKELTKGGAPAHLLEHIARLSDPDYVCLSIAENKLTVGPLVEKLLELASRPLAPPKDRSPPDPTTTTTTNTNTTNGINSNINSNTNNATGSNNSDGSEVKATARAAAGRPPPAATSAASPPPLPAAAADAVAAAEAAAAAAAARKLYSMGYGDERGPLWVRRELAEMMGDRLFHRQVDPDNLCIAAGAKCILRLLMLVLAEQGQGCLIPGPYFPGFDKVLTTTGVKAWVVNRSSGGGGGVEGGMDEGISPRVLQAGLRSARAADVIIRTLLITSPHNPTGRMYSPKALLGAIAWARKRSLHVIVDEVYANCVHRPNASFRSVGSLLGSGGVKGRGVMGMGMGDDVHIMYGLSKDLGVAGWRVGVLYTESKEVMSVVSKLVMTSQASSDTMDLVGRLFQEPGFIAEYFRQHQEGLRSAYASLVNNLGRRGIMHLQAEAGLFVMLDLREFLEDSSKEAEARLWRQMLDRTGVNLTPGDAFHCSEPGWFRLCFAYQQTDVVTRSVDRVADFLQAIMLERAASLDQEGQEPLPPPPPTPTPTRPTTAASPAATTAASAAAVTAATASVAADAAATAAVTTAVAHSSAPPQTFQAQKKEDVRAEVSGGTPRNGVGGSSSGGGGGGRYGIRTGGAVDKHFNPTATTTTAAVNGAVTRGAEEKKKSETEGEGGGEGKEEVGGEGSLRGEKVEGRDAGGGLDGVEEAGAGAGPASEKIDVMGGDGGGSAMSESRFAIDTVPW